MSGIIGIVNTDGAPVSKDLLDRMVAFLRFRGPDAQNICCGSEAGLGHALLDTSGGAGADKQPCSIDGKIWIVADARIDGRSELQQKLQASGLTVPPGASHAELILFAYAAWGKDCVHHLIGDFAFAILDTTSKELFCARDHFGVKPFYYANLPRSFVFSNTLNCLRLHPEVSWRLNHLAIADYLLFGGNQDPRTTSFDQIQRLPPAHSLVCSQGQVTISEYWKLPLPSELIYKNRQDYIEDFRVLLQIAVQDRLPPGPVAVSMSGGLDSSTVAATARLILGEDRKSRLQAYSVVYDRLIPDQERRFAAQVADFCDIPLHYLVADDYQLFQHWNDGDASPAEPCDAPLRAIEDDLYKQIAAQTRVVLTGEGGDPLLVASAEDVLKLLKARKFWSLAAGYMHCALSQRSMPKVGLRTLIRARTKAPENCSLPEWINPELAHKLDLAHRERELEHDVVAVKHRRCKAYEVLSQVHWANTFELYDSGNSPQPVEARHPLFDVRLVKFSLSLATLPWCVGKQIMREAMSGSLPKKILRRPKTALAGDPLVELLKQPQSVWVDTFQPTPALLQYVTPSRIPPVSGKRNFSSNAWVTLRPLSLNHWLQMQPS